jgi:hypothetical protein
MLPFFFSRNTAYSLICRCILIFVDFEDAIHEFPCSNDVVHFSGVCSRALPSGMLAIEVDYFEVLSLAASHSSSPFPSVLWDVVEDVSSANDQLFDD